MALDITRMFCKEDDVDVIYDEYVHKTQQTLQQPVVRKNAIVTLCASGAGTSEAFKSVIDEELERMGISDILVTALNYNDVRENSQRYELLRSKYNIMACVGNIDAGIGVPFFHISRLLSQEDKLSFVKFISGLNAQMLASALPEDKTEHLHQECCKFLGKNVVYVNPDVAVKYAVRYIDAIDLPKLRDNQSLKFSLILHLGFMLERNIVGKQIIFDGQENFIAANRELYDLFRSNMFLLEEAFEITVNDAEICYIIQTTKGAG